MTVVAIETDSLGTDVAQNRALPPSMVERMTLILDAFDAPSTRLTLEQVARTTHLPRSTAHRILDQLVRLQWLSHSSFGYALGARALNLGGTGGNHLELREATAAVLHELQLRTGMVAHLAILDGADVRYLDKVGGRFAAVVPSRVGGRAPAQCTALGKAMLAWLPAEQVEDRVMPTLGRQTSRTICDMVTLHRELGRIRDRNGLAFERGECFADISCVAAAIRGPEGPEAAISLVGDAHTALERVAPLVVVAARQVTQELYPMVRLRTAEPAWN
ncbi:MULTISPECIES: IclR family transcriptional regulator [Amycolatopsis]|uniref:IclR family transcriptional regulator n=1 Tax=Amycolatopsis dendrobii TaxID=2760662 RepID=A0A7W3W0X4_9PSEU|nr:MULTISPECIES: IclR family transcriptional regulator [Amycolatopsis]MBB1156307.1 IclR family transcriptional regulator [Amycolatopsis dendrobii]UKD58830.1 IclR family transcriptional regulator [Amycolatopsis sp. FU40]